MVGKTFQCVDSSENLEACKNCGSFDFEMSEVRKNSIVCAHCGRFHKQISPSVASAGEILDEMFEFARKHGE